LSQVVKDEDNPLLKVLSTIFDASLKVIDFALMLAPFAIFAIVFNTAYKLGAGSCRIWPSMRWWLSWGFCCSSLSSMPLP
jgi:Na+/H+-dicarboxylate symporter